MKIGKLNPLGKLNFPGFQEILDFTATGSESSVSVAVDGDTDKEYKIVYRSVDASGSIYTYLNDDTGNNYGYQYLENASGTITAGRGAWGKLTSTAASLEVLSLLTPAGFIKTAFTSFCYYSSGTTMSNYTMQGFSWNNTANVTKISFVRSTGTFTADTRITVYARRSN